MDCDNCKLQSEEGTCKGRIAVPGCIEGIVHIILDANNITSIDEDEILVTPMTDPDCMPAIKMSKGVITDRGGALCHAAIVCRELGRPCIVGTNMATKVLKNGSRVQLCANHGKVFTLD